MTWIPCHRCHCAPCSCHQGSGLRVLPYTFTPEPSPWIPPTPLLSDEDIERIAERLADKLEQRRAAAVQLPKPVPVSQRKRRK